MKINFCLACKNCYLIFVGFIFFLLFSPHRKSKFLPLENVKQIKIMEKFLLAFLFATNKNREGSHFSHKAYYPPVQQLQRLKVAPT